MGGFDLARYSGIALFRRFLNVLAIKDEIDTNRFDQRLKIAISLSLAFVVISCAATRSRAPSTIAVCEHVENTSAHPSEQ